MVEKRTDLQAEQNRKDGNQLFHDLFVKLEGKLPEMGDPSDLAFLKNGSLHKACIGLFKHISTLKNNAEKNYWIEITKDKDYLKDILARCHEELNDELDELIMNEPDFDFIASWCKLYNQDNENFLIALITFYEESETPSPDNRKAWN